MATPLSRYVDSVSAFDNIEVSLISHSSHALRDPYRDIDELMDSIREHGLLEPIIVRPKGRKFEVVAGNRRLTACKQLRHRRVKCIVTDLDDAASYEVSIVENVQRRTLDPLEEALAFKTYCERFGWGSQTELAKKIGKSQEYISHRMKLLELPEDAKDALREGRITPTGAEELTWIKDGQTRANALHLIENDGYSTKLIREFARDRRGMETEEKSEEPYFLQSGRKSATGYSRVIAESILVLRISLMRLDAIIVKVGDSDLRRTLVSKRLVLHNLIDELIQLKNQDTHLSRRSSVITR